MRNPKTKPVDATRVKNGDVRGTAYVTAAERPFKTNGVKSTSVVGGDLRARGGKCN
ncbi:MAG: hypothetical protein IJY04_04615 [Clostridia bacterium]|nr:hypothetical protein [Clostridia bacterium]